MTDFLQASTLVAPFLPYFLPSHLVLCFCSLCRAHPSVGRCTRNLPPKQATNDTDYLLLASEDVSVFFDNNFVSKTDLTFVSPGESFQTFLGADPAVKVRRMFLSKGFKMCNGRGRRVDLPRKGREKVENRVSVLFF